MTTTDPTWYAIDSGCAHLRHERDTRGVHRLTLAAPQRFNVLSEDVLTAMQAALAQVAADEAARALVIAAEGKAFCAGHDLREMRAQPELAYYQRLFAQCSRLMLGLVQLPVPVLARVQGVAAAAGCQLVAQCDLAIAAEGARFAVNGIDLGLFCATPSVPLSRNLPAKPALEMLMTGRFLSADEALAHGLVNRVVPAAELEAETLKIATQLAGAAPLALRGILDAINVGGECGIEEGLEYESAQFGLAFSTQDMREGTSAFLERRKPEFKNC